MAPGILNTVGIARFATPGEVLSQERAKELGFCGSGNGTAVQAKGEGATRRAAKADIERVRRRLPRADRTTAADAGGQENQSRPGPL